MRAVVTRVGRSTVSVDGRVTGSIRSGLLVLLGVGVDDAENDAAWMSEKLVGLRIFKDEAGAMNRNVSEALGSILLVSQFTLYGDARKGRRPSFVAAAKEPLAKPLYERVGALIAEAGVTVAYGEFGADMEVQSLNDGPVTILLDSKRAF